MKTSHLSKFLAVFLVVLMLVSALPINALAASIVYDESKGSTYYNVISKKDWDIAPGINETEIVLNNDAGTRRQVLHTATVDLNNPYTKVIPGYKGMWPQKGNYGTEATSVQALNAEKLGYGNVVVATNCSLSWYTEAYYKNNPEYIGEPLGYSILNGELYHNSQGLTKGNPKTVIVINYNNHPLTGEPRPDSIPRVWIRSINDPLTGWEEQAIPVLFDFLVKPDENGNPVNLSKKEDHGNGIASRTFVGVKADGTLVITVSDGEQAPYSTGFTTYEMADYMLKMGCVIAANCDGGGSTTFCSQRPGEDLKVNCSLADGGERPTTSTILVISTAPADGVFARATLSTECDYFTPGSTVTFSALGTDAVGTKVDIPSDVQWKIKESDMGTIENGVFTSNGTEGTVTAQMIYNDVVVGEKTITIVTPTELIFEQPVVTIPFGKTAKVPVKAIATINNVKQEIGLGDNDIIFTTTNTEIGKFEGLSFVAVEEDEAPADLTSIVTATLNMGNNPTASVQLNLGKASEVLWDFEGGQADIDEWNVINNRKNAAHWDYYLNLSLADSSNGQVHDGNYSMRLETNGLSSADSHSEQYAWIRMGVDGEAIVLENARSVGFWLYVPEDNIQCWVQGHYMTDSNGDGTYDNEAIVSMMESENVYYNIDESGWHYLSMDISAFEKVALKAATQYDKDPSDGMNGEKGEFFLALVFHKAINNKLWQENGSINGNYTYYLDNFTVDYSEAVDDRENPVFDKVYLNGTTALVKRDVITTTSNVLNLSAAVADASVRLDADKNEVPLHNISGLNPASAKVYIDGVEVASSLSDGVLSANNITVADGYHRVKFEICDNSGNKSVVIRVVKVESGVEKSTLSLVPADSTLNRIPFGSIYWMNLEATNIETIQSVSTVIDLNNVNHWELDHMELAEGFTADYTINSETNTATITITRTGENIQKGAATLAKLPVRILYFDTDINTPGYTAETYWTTYPFWAQDMKMDVDMGLITHVDESTSTFSNEEFHVDTEMYTSMANMDKAYFLAHGTTHVHTPVELEDKEATCTQAGYTDRTFCEGCNSVIEWGTTIPVVAHEFNVDLENKKFVCECGRDFTGTGLQLSNGKYYYTVNGELTSGWITIDDEWYYFDDETYSTVETLFNGYVTYEFEADGKMKSGQWYRNSVGIRYYYGPSYLRGGKFVMTWYEIDGKNYCMDKSGYVATGTRWVNDDRTADIYTWYTFDENGACLGRWHHDGLVEWNGTLYYLKDGISQYGMYLVDGDYYYFYFTDFYAGIENDRFYCKYNNGLLPQGYYRFGSDGKMLNNTVYCVDDTLYYFVKGNESKGDGSVVINDKQWIIEDSGKVLFTGFTNDENSVLQYYVDGVQVGDHKWNDGKVTSEATCTSEGIKTYTCSDCNEVIEITLEKLPHLDENEDYICDTCDSYIEHEHIWDDCVINTPATCTENGDKTLTCKCGETKTEAITAPGHTDENGDLYCDICNDKLNAKTGLVFESDGNVRYYVNGTATRAGLVHDSQGNYYYINSSLKAVKNCTYAFNDKNSNGLLPAGEYQFDAEGKMINPPASDVMHIHAWGEGEITTEATCGNNGIRTYICDCGLSKTETIDALGHIDENEDFVCDRCDAAIEHVHVWDDGVVTTDPTCSEEGVKTFTCKCGETKTEAVAVLGHIDENEDFVCDRCDAAIEHVHVWDDGTVTTDPTCSEEGVKTFTCKCGETKTEAVAVLGHIDENEDFVCDRCDAAIEHDHIFNLSEITTPATCTENGVKTLTCKCGETKTEAITAPGHIDENGDLYCDICNDKLNAKTGLVFESDGNVRYYVNGTATRAGLVHDSQGNYYYINSSLKAVKNCTYAFNDKYSNGLLPAGEYQFDAEGKMINPPASNVMHIHAWGEGEITTEATCGNNGIRTYICDCGLSKTETIDALGHIDKNEDFVCDRCDAAIEHVHVWDDGTVTTDPTCSEEGVKTFTCKCGETKTEAVAVLGHIDENEDFVCDRCDAAIEHEHNFDSIDITTPATCTENGVKTLTCKCGETKTEAITAPGHIDENGDLYCDICNDKLNAKTGLVFESDGNVRYYVNGTATRAGLVHDSQGNYYYINSSLKAVKNCTYAFNDKYSNGLLLAGEYQFDATGKMINPPASDVMHIHAWGEGEITTEATCGNNGIRTYICDCGLSKTETIDSLGHIDEDENFACDRCDVTIEHEHNFDIIEITTPATCTEDGVKTLTCKCGESKTTAITARGHFDENGDLSCDKCSEKFDAKTGLVFEADGTIRYYVNGRATRAGLVQDSKGNYYYINSSLKAVKNCYYAFNDKYSNGLLPAGEYWFDAEGKLVLNK